MRRVLLTIPEGTKFELLPEEYQQAISSIFGGYCLPMYGTKAYNGKIVCDATCGDNFDPALTFPGWTIIGMWSWDGQAESTTELIPLDTATFMNHLVPLPVCDPETGEPTGEYNTDLREPSIWFGWPRSF